MRITYGSNIGSLQAQRRLADASSARAHSFERLASGQRINRASDDAAGLAIADRLRASRRVAGVASRNVNDGISTISIMNSTLEQQGLIYTRLSELAEQSANGVYGNSQRSALDREYKQLLREYDRLGATSTFNGLSLFSGASINLQVGLDSSSNSQISISGMSRLVSAWGFDRDLITSFADFDNNGGADGGDLAMVFDAVEQGISRSAVDSAFAGQMIEFSTRLADGEVRTVLVGAKGVSDSNGLGIGLVAFVEQDSGLFRLTNEDFHAEWSNYFSTPALAGPIRVNSETGALSLSEFTVADGLGGYITLDLSNVFIRSGEQSSPDELFLSGVESAGRARAALDLLEDARETLNERRGSLGGIESRLQSAAQIITTTAENYAAAESRIRDIDVAVESARAVQLDILQQFAAAVLAQANQTPALAIGLLRG